MTYVTIACSGRRFRVMTTSDEDHIAKIIKASGDFYERELLSYLRLLGLRGECAVDVGANIGNHSIFFLPRFWQRKLFLSKQIKI